MFSKNNISEKMKSTIFFTLVVIQIILALLIYIFDGTYLILPLTISVFIPAIIICYISTKRYHIIISIILLISSLHWIFIGTQAYWGFKFGSDSINDLHIANALLEKNFFVMGNVGYNTRYSYSYYPMIHVYTNVYNIISGIDINKIAVFIIPIIISVVASLLLYRINLDFWKFDDKVSAYATIFYGTVFYYIAFHSEYIRESFAFIFALTCIWLLGKYISKNKIEIHILILLSFILSVLSHHITPYMILAIFAVITVSMNIFYGDRKLNILLLQCIMIFAIYNYVFLTDYSVKEINNLVRGLSSIFQGRGFSMETAYEEWRVYFSVAYYAIFGIVAGIGGITLLRNYKKKEYLIMAAGLFGVIFLVSFILRISTTPQAWSWTYYMALRGTIWAFIGISALAAIGIRILVFQNSKRRYLRFPVLLVIFALLAVGEFSQFSLQVSSPQENRAITYPLYSSALWLRGNTQHGKELLVAPYTVNPDAFEVSRNMAPYAYLTEYFLPEGSTIKKYDGYVPFINQFYDVYLNSTSVQIVYSNGYSKIGYNTP